MKATNSRRGMALLMFGVFCMVMIPMIGLAIDGSMAYMMRAQVSRAVDAAALAGARSLNVGADVTSQSASATAIAQKYFDANLPGGKWGTANITRSVSVGQDNSTRIRWVTVTAGVDLPLSFMGMVGFNSTHIGLTGTAQRRDVNVMLVLDNSGSMQRGNAMPPMITDATDFVNMFAGGRDQVGLIQFTGASWLAFAPSTNFKSASPSVSSLIGQLKSDNGATNTSQAIWMAYQQLKALNQPGALNVIVLFTDGLANTFTANFGSALGSGACRNVTGLLPGVILAYTDNTGMSGLSDPVATKLNDTPESRSAPNSGSCLSVFPSTSIASMLATLPSSDTNGNSTNGTGSISAYAPVNLRQVTPANVTNAGLNALDDAANRIRSDATYAPVIYAIGLGSNPGAPPDQTLMARVANDPSSTSFNKTQPAGLFIFSPTTADLHSAFVRVASEILRLSK